MLPQPPFVSNNPIIPANSKGDLLGQISKQSTTTKTLNLLKIVLASTLEIFQYKACSPVEDREAGRVHG